MKPASVNYTVNGKLFEIASKAVTYAIQEILNSSNKNGVSILDEEGNIYGTACKIKNGVMIVWLNGSTTKYTNITSICGKDVAICQGRIVQL